MTNKEQQIIHISSALFMNDRNETLLVRKKGTTHFIQPGGKIAPEETAVQALLREVKEELEYDIIEKQIEYIGEFSSTAIYEKNCRVTSKLFLIKGHFTPMPKREIEEARWVSIDEAYQMPIAPLTRDHVLKVAEGLVS